MHTIIPVPLPQDGYEIHIGTGLLDSLGEGVRAVLPPGRCAILTDDTVAPHYAARVEASLRDAGFDPGVVVFPHGEGSKTLETVQTLYDGMFELGLDRTAFVVALGGGVCGDMAGFAAATFLRGIPFVQVPTTLLAMVDSSSGGKTGVNHTRGKNLIGAFHQPRRVWIDPLTLNTLPPREFRGGLAEVVKHGVIRDEAYFSLVEQKAEAILALHPACLCDVIAGSCRIKGGVVAADEREAGERAHLNFGHTFAHAYESLSGYTIPHGEAVAMGMVAACHLAESLHMLETPDTRLRLCALLKTLGLPVQAPALPPDALLASMYGDKKTERGRLRFVLPRGIGAVETVPVEDTEAVLAAFEAAAS